MISADVKPNKTTRNNFSFNFGWYSISMLILSFTGVMVGGLNLLKTQNEALRSCEKWYHLQM